MSHQSEILRSLIFKKALIRLGEMCQIQEIFKKLIMHVDFTHGEESNVY